MLTLEEAKLHLRVDDNHEDVAILCMIYAATAAVANHLNMDLGDLDADAPAPVKSAALLLVGDLYANRESQIERPLHLNLTFERLLAPYRVYL